MAVVAGGERVVGGWPVVLDPSSLALAGRAGMGVMFVRAEVAHVIHPHGEEWIGFSGEQWVVVMPTASAWQYHSLNTEGP